MGTQPPLGREKLHNRVTRTLALRVLASDHTILVFPKEADLSAQLGVSRTVLRESMKVLVDKGMVQMKPRAGTRSRPRAEWRQLDPDILIWQAEAGPSPSLLRNLCEVRLAIEPTAAGFAAVRAMPEELDRIERCVAMRATTRDPGIEKIIDLDLEFHSAVVAASRNPLLVALSETIRTPIRTAMACTAQFASTIELGLEAHQTLLECLRRRDPVAARKAAEEAVGLAMLAVEKAIRTHESRGRPAK